MKCNKCNKEFSNKTLYWHNWEIIGFFCEKCFKLIAKNTCSGAKIKRS